MAACPQKQQKATIQHNKCNYKKDGYTFTGWNTTADGTGDAYADQALFAPYANITLYAQWKKGEPIVSLDKEIYESDKDAWQSNEGQNGLLDLTYDTAAGKWTDSVDVQHDNGTFVVRIPTAITYQNMSVGDVNISNDYDVIVEGVLAEGKTVSVSAETGKSVSLNGTAANANDSIIETTSMKDDSTNNVVGAYSDTNKRTFTAAQVSMLNDDKTRVIGTSVKDNIAMSGRAYSSGVYNGTVQYSSVLS